MNCVPLIYSTVQWLQVSWIRHTDTHLLTVGRFSYTPDTRFSPLHPVLSPDYQLRILGVHKRWVGYTGIGRKNAAEFYVFPTLSNSFGHPKSSVYCAGKLLLFTIVNSLRFGMSPNYLNSNLSYSFFLSL